MPARPTCDRCTRPLTVCYCAHVPTLPTRSRVVLLQHPRERRMGVGTARMAHLGLPNSVLRVGLDFSADPVVQAELTGPAAPYVLFPGRDARDVAELPRDRPITLLVLDGTWWQARKLLRLNPALAALPRVAFSPRRPSAYEIRRQPAEFCVSTIEALAEVLDVLEPERGPFGRLLDPFRAMVDKQRWYEEEVRAQRHRKPPRKDPGAARSSLAARLRADWPRLVCVQGEANAWARRDPDRQDPEITHWVACRPATGAIYQAVVAPRRPLAPHTPQHTGLPAATLLGGGTVEAWRRSLQDFVNPDDILVSWGRFYTNLAAADGLMLPAEALDLRAEVSQLWRRRAGTVEQTATRLGLGPPPLGPAGRGGRRLALLVEVLRAVLEPRP